MSLKPQSSSGTGLSSADLTINLPTLGVNQVIPLFDGTLDPDFDASYRLWLGYQGCDGVGARIRYWEFDQDTIGGVSVLGPPLMHVTTSHAWDAYNVDIEITDSRRLDCNLEVVTSTGVRHVEYREILEQTITSLVGNNPLSVSTGKDFSGIGPTGAIELRRQCLCNLSAFAVARASILIGDEDTFVRATIPTVVDRVLTIRQRNNIKMIYEVQGGGEFTWSCCCGSLFLRGGWETQYWDSFGLNGTGMSDDASVGFSGLVLALGVHR